MASPKKGVLPTVHQRSDKNKETQNKNEHAHLGSHGLLPSGGLGLPCCFQTEQPTPTYFYAVIGQSACARSNKGGARTHHDNFAGHAGSGHSLLELSAAGQAALGLPEHVEALREDLRVCRTIPADTCQMNGPSTDCPYRRRPDGCAARAKNGANHKTCERRRQAKRPAKDEEGGKSKAKGGGRSCDEGRTRVGYSWQFGFPGGGRFSDSISRRNARVVGRRRWWPGRRRKSAGVACRGRTFLCTAADSDNLQAFVSGRQDESAMKLQGQAGVPEKSRGHAMYGFHREERPHTHNAESGRRGNPNCM